MSSVMILLFVSVCSYSCQALLLYYYISNQSVGGAELSNRLSGSGGAMGAGLQLDPASTHVTPIGKEILQIRKSV